ncbi:MAG: hypothetical protein AAF629_18135 [Chloroflexota bacterium]
MLSQEMQDLLGEIYDDGNITPSEIRKLREETDKAIEKVLAEMGAHGEAAALFKSFDVTDQLQQQVLLKIRKGKVSDTGRAMVQAAIQANLTLLQTSLDAFTK